MPNRLQRHRFRVSPRNDDGLSVMEMVVAICVTVVVLISAGAAFIRMGEAQRSAEAADRGTQMIQDQLETIRKLPYNKVGCYRDDVNPFTGVGLCPAGLLAPSTIPNAYNGELVVNLGPTRPTGAAEGGAPVTIQSDLVVGMNKYKVTTAVTWADHRDPIPGYLTNLTLAPYTAKRVTVTASWTLGATERSVTREWLRSPTSSEVVPQSVGVDTGSRCPEASPICSISITEGQVLGDAPGLGVVRPIEFTVKMSYPADSGTITVGGNTLTLTPSSDKKTLTYVIAGPGGIAGVKPGPNTVTINVVPSGGLTAAPVDKVVNWRFPISVDYQMLNLTPVADSSRITNTNPAFASGLTTGTEKVRPWFCVKDTNNTLLEYTAVIFDEAKVDDMDAYTKPNIYATGLAAANPNLTAVITGHPTGAVSGYSTVSGYVQGNSQSPGYLNTIRWTYGFQPGVTVFSGQSSSVTVSGVRPGDGAVANATLTMPVYRVPAASDCLHADIYTPPVVPAAPIIGTAVAGNGQATVNWSAPASNGGSAITGYSVQTVNATTGVPYGMPRAAGAGATSLVWTGLTNTSPVKFVVSAVNVVGMGPASAASNTVTPIGAPGAPIIASAVAGNGQATVNWSAPASNGGSAITGYWVQTVDPSLGSPVGVARWVAGAGATSLVWTSLTQDAVVRFDVSAVNAVGTGTRSAASNAVVPTGTVPCGVTIGTAVGGPAGGASTSAGYWSAAACDGGYPILGYHVRIVNAVTLVNITGINEGPGVFSKTYTIGPVVQVRYQVLPYNVKGYGPASLYSNWVWSQ